MARRIALVAHDNRKQDLAERVSFSYRTPAQHRLYCTGTKGRIVRKTFDRRAREDGANLSMDPRLLKSSPLGGDQQLGAVIADAGIDVLVLMWNPMEPQPHDVDVKALLRLAGPYNIPTACNRSTADSVISSPLFSSAYTRVVKEHRAYLERSVQGSR
jgi:methylglyoxal synthase